MTQPVHRRRAVSAHSSEVRRCVMTGCQYKAWSLCESEARKATRPVAVRTKKKGAGKSRRLASIRLKLECVDQIELQTVQRRLGLTRLHARRQSGVQQVAVERPAMPPGEAGGGVLAQSPERVEA